MTVMIRYRWPMNVRQGKPMTVPKAVAFALSDPDPEARNRDTTELVGRLLTTLHDNGLLSGMDVVNVLNNHLYEEVQDDGTAKEE